MSVKIRLRPLKARGVFRLEVIDSRSPRDGRAIEQIGFNDRSQSPSVINVCVDQALRWLESGAQPTVAARSILRKSGVLYKRHLLGGVKKGVLTPQQVDEKFNVWKEESAHALRQKREKQISELNQRKAELLLGETAKKEKRQEAILQKQKQHDQELLKAVQEPTEEGTQPQAES